jgi:hypothetical protein
MYCHEQLIVVEVITPTIPIGTFKRRAVVAVFLHTLIEFGEPFHVFAPGQHPQALGEFGSLEDPTNSSHRSQWMDQARSDVKTSFPKLKAMLYFDSYPSGEPGNDWRLFNVNAASLAAYKNWGLDSYFNPTAQNTVTNPPSATKTATPAPTATLTPKPTATPTPQASTTTTPGATPTNNTSSTPSSRRSQASVARSTQKRFDQMNSLQKVVFILSFLVLLNISFVSLCAAVLTIKRHLSGKL